MEESGLSERALAAEADVAPSAVMRFLNRSRDLTLATAAKLCEALGLRLVEGGPRRRGR